ncbi:MAG: hypothetical protein RMY29_013040 [Nostoc sp. CreGUA01]|nr:hypothetical protein [Nostoc sp. CreGUA01]
MTLQYLFNKNFALINKVWGIGSAELGVRNYSPSSPSSPSSPHLPISPSPHLPHLPHLPNPFYFNESSGSQKLFTPCLRT